MRRVLSPQKTSARKRRACSGPGVIRSIAAITCPNSGSPWLSLPAGKARNPLASIIGHTERGPATATSCPAATVAWARGTKG